ncbi:MAG: cellulase family glycosylhydrolase [Nocardioidaceae bacterium]
MSSDAAPSPPSGRGRLLRRSGALLGVGAVVAALVGVGAGSLGWPRDGGMTSSTPIDQPAPPADGPPRSQGRLLVGTQFQGTWSTYTDDERRTLLDDLVDIGVKTVRISISWAMLQPDRPTADDAGWSWTYGVPRVDSVVAMARSRGLIVHATFGRTPSWANDGAGEGAAPTSLADWRRAVAFVAHRYAGKVSSWEVWNEPNHATYFPNGTPESYTDLLCAAYPILHAAAPGTPVVYGGLSGNDWRFLEASYGAGAKGCFDVMAVHPYQRSGYSPDSPAPDEEPWYFSNVSLIRAVQARNHDLLPVWFTEFGWSTHPNAPGTPEYQRGVTEQQQATYLVRTLQLTEERYPYVKRAYIYTTRDETGFDQENNNFGLYTLSLQPKPAVTALERFLSTS